MGASSLDPSFEALVQRLTDWNVSFWFAVTSPLLGVLLAIIALAIFRP